MIAKIALIREKTTLLFSEYSILLSIRLSGAESTQKITANSTYWKAKRREAGGVARSRGKECLFWGRELSTRSSDTDVNFSIIFGPPLHAKYPGETDRTEGDLIVNGAHFRLCLAIIWKRRPLSAQTGEVVKCLWGGFWGSGFLGGVEIFSLRGDRVKILFQVCLEIFFTKSAQNFSTKIRLKIFREKSGREISGTAPSRSC